LARCAHAYQDARFETGWDDTQAFTGSHIEGSCLDCYAVDLNSLWAMDAAYLARIADALGRRADAKRFRNEHNRMVKEINDKLWDDRLGLYCSRIWKDNKNGTPNFLTRITPINFYPLICGAPDVARARRMLDYFHRTNKFWGKWMVPTLPYDDPDWKRQEYWNGHVWPPVNYLLWQGLKRYDTLSDEAEFVRRSVRLFMRSWKDGKYISSENYRSDNGAPDDDPHYTWGALLPLIGVESLVDIGPDLKPVPRKIDFHETLTLRNIPIGGTLYCIEAKNSVVSVTRESVRDEHTSNPTLGEVLHSSLKSQSTISKSPTNED
jgi:glycogen debranching enzyme